MNYIKFVIKITLVSVMLLLFWSSDEDKKQYGRFKWENTNTFRDGRTQRWGEILFIDENSNKLIFAHFGEGRQINDFGTYERIDDNTIKIIGLDEREHGIYQRNGIYTFELAGKYVKNHWRQENCKSRCRFKYDSDYTGSYDPKEFF